MHSPVSASTNDEENGLKLDELRWLENLEPSLAGSDYARVGYLYNRTGEEWPRVITHADSAVWANWLDQLADIRHELLVP